MNLVFAAITYRSLRERIRSVDPEIEQIKLWRALLKSITDLHEIHYCGCPSALADEALANGLQGRIAEMQDRLGRLQDRATKRHELAKDVMIDLDLKKITHPELSFHSRGSPSPGGSQ